MWIVLSDYDNVINEPISRTAQETDSNHGGCEVLLLDMLWA